MRRLLILNSIENDTVVYVVFGAIEFTVALRFWNASSEIGVDDGRKIKNAKCRNTRKCLADTSIERQVKARDARSYVVVIIHFFNFSFYYVVVVIIFQISNFQFC